MECNAPRSPSPVPPPILPDITEVGVLTSPVPTSIVSCYTDSFVDLEFAALLKENEEVDCLQQTLAATRSELGKQKALFARLESAFNKLKDNYEQISQSLSAQTRQNKLDARNISDLKDTISDLRKQNALLQSDQHALPMLHQLLATLTAPDVAAQCHSHYLPIYSPGFPALLTRTCSQKELLNLAALVSPGSPSRYRSTYISTTHCCPYYFNRSCDSENLRLLWCACCDAERYYTFLPNV